MPLSDLTAKTSALMHKRTFWLYVGLFVLAYVVFLLLLLPAAYLLPPDKPGPNSLKIGQVQGTVWSGNLGWARWQALSASKIHWDFNAWAIFNAAWEYDVDFTLDGIPVTGRVAKTLGGAWRVRDVVAGLKLQDTPYIADNLRAALPDKLQGDLAMRLEEMSVLDQWPESIQGSFLLQALKIGDLPNLGDWEGQIYQEQGRVVLAFAPRGKVLQGKGLWVLSPDLQWTFTLRIKSGEIIDNDLSGWLSLLGAPDAEGYRRIQQSGRLQS